jgi:hypothetical protein
MTVYFIRYSNYDKVAAIREEGSIEKLWEKIKSCN